MKTYSIIICVVLFAIPFFSNAQISVSSDNQQFLSIITAPQFPRPNDSVTITLESFSFDLNVSQIVWSVDGRVIGQGTGNKKISINAGTLGKSINVSVDVVPLNGSAFHKDFVITPATVEFLWQAKTYTPPFYKGKALFSGQAPVTIVAVPQSAKGSVVADANILVYRWDQNGDNFSELNGYGKQSINVSGSFWGSDDVVAVTVSTPGNEPFTKNSLTLSPRTPQIIVYENNPLLGVMFNRAVSGSFVMNKNSEVSFFAAPFYFIQELLTSDRTTYAWTMNGQPAGSNGNGNGITFRMENGQTGISNIALTINQSKTNFQNSSTGFSIQTK